MADTDTTSSDESEPETSPPAIRIRRINHPHRQSNTGQFELNNNNNGTSTTENQNNNNNVPDEPAPVPETLVITVSFGWNSLPPVATFLALLQIMIYFCSEWFGIKTEEDIFISWEKVVQERQFWRLFVAHFYHSGRCHMFLNVITLLAMGRYLEKKIKPWPMLILVQIMGMVSNVFYMLISTFVCSNPAHVSTYGFSHIHYGLRILLAYTQDPRSYEPNLFLGLYPVYLSIQWAPWQPLLETSMQKLVTEEINISGSIGGILTGYLAGFMLFCLPHQWSLKDMNSIRNPFSFMKASVVRFTSRRRRPQQQLQAQ